MVTKAMEVTMGSYKKMLIDRVIPDIKRKFPRPPASASPEDRIVWLRQDNACPPLVNDDPELTAALTSDGWDIRMLNQPANSLDTNILDLGFFASIQSPQEDKTTPGNIDDLLKVVNDAWEEESPAKLNRVWLSLQACLKENMLAGGDSAYKLPHLHKGRLETAGTLPWQLECKEEAWAKSSSALVELQAEVLAERAARAAGVTAAVGGSA
ncbi:unnamed protein product, partial [Ectocarpus sp. 12 AP-2014]